MKALLSIAVGLALGFMSPAQPSSANPAPMTTAAATMPDPATLKTLTGGMSDKDLLSALKTLLAAYGQQQPQSTPTNNVTVMGPSSPADSMAATSSDAMGDARSELAEAQKMADEAISNADAATPSSSTGSSDTTHHSMNGLATSCHSLGPDRSDPKHHSMGELF